MQYYRIKHNGTRVQEVGSFPQLEKKIKLGEYENIELFARRNQIKKDWQLPELGLANKAKQTSILSSCISDLTFLVFKDNFLEFLLDFNIGDNNSWPLKIHSKKELTEEYRLFHISQPSDNKYIDFKSSEFYIGKQWPWEDQKIGKVVKINDYKEYLNISEVIKAEDELLNIQCEKLVFDFSNASEDFIRFSELPQAGYYVSGRLRKAIIDIGFTGMDFVPVEEYSKKFKVKNYTLR